MMKKTPEPGKVGLGIVMKSLLFVCLFGMASALFLFLSGNTEAAKTEQKSESDNGNNTTLRDGTYEGRTDANYRGTVIVTVDGGKIKEIQAKPIGKDARYKKEIDAILAKIVESQQYHVDAYSGATRYTVAVVKAVEHALRDAEVKENPSE